MCDNQGRGLSFWQNVFIAACTFAVISACVESGAVRRDFFKQIEKSFEDYNRSFSNAPKFERACGKPIVLSSAPALKEYEPQFLSEAAREAETYKDRVPRLLEMVADWRTYRRAVRAGQ